MNSQTAIVLMDAMALMNGHKTLREMIGEMPVRQPKVNPHQGRKEIAKRLKIMETKNGK